MRAGIRALSIMAFVAGLQGPVGFAAESETDPMSRFDPALGVTVPQSPAISSGSSVVVDKDTRQPTVRLPTDAPLAPYVQAERRAELSPEEQRLLGKERERGPLSGYHLEAGIGLFIEDKTSLSLGYRFHDPPTLLDDRRRDPRLPAGDLHLSIDIKVPF